MLLQCKDTNNAPGTPSIPFIGTKNVCAKSADNKQTNNNPNSKNLKSGKPNYIWQASNSKYCLNLKYRDNSEFRTDLHSTPLLPVEDATATNYASNLFWGAKLVEVEGRKYYFGCNVLGKLLAELRATKGKLEYSLPAYMHLFGEPILAI